MTLTHILNIDKEIQLIQEERNRSNDSVSELHQLSGRTSKTQGQ